MDRVLCTTFNPLTTHTYTHSPTHPQNNNMVFFLCVHRSLLAYNIKTDLKHEVLLSHGRNNVLIMMDYCEINLMYVSRL